MGGFAILELRIESAICLGDAYVLPPFDSRMVVGRTLKRGLTNGYDRQIER